MRALPKHPIQKMLLSATISEKIEKLAKDPLLQTNNIPFTFITIGQV